MLDGERVTYALRRSARTTLGITVTPKAELKVTAPQEASTTDIERVLTRKAPWITRQLRETSALPPSVPTHRWVSGETHVYLGRQYRLKVRDQGTPGVRLVGRYFEVGVTDRTDHAAVETVMNAWYRTRARETFERRMQRLIDRTPALRLTEPPPLIVRTIRTRWGSCSPSGRILMNVESVKLPIGCLDYVLMHELCHLRHNDHSRKFWRHLDRCMPGWERWRRRLDRVEI